VSGSLSKERLKILGLRFMVNSVLCLNPMSVKLAIRG